ncbi:methyltransferase [Oscillospiraceae bacterium MB08-C2-2]|nr:methyltransferase [Oscillospiraceae bacterium MB08-C2-2]
MENNEHWEDFGAGIRLLVSPEHTFGTDSFLLASFAGVRRKDKACDLGTGCGIIPFLWARSDSAPQSAFAVDIQPQAIGQLSQSVTQSGLEGRVLPLLADLREGLPEIEAGSLDIITCNPPYKAVDTGFQNQGENQRLARHEVTCTIEDVCKAAARLLRFGGRLCLCQRPERLVDALEAMRRWKLEPKRLQLVQKRGDTAPWLFLVEGKRGAKPFLQIEAPFVCWEGDSPSRQLQELFPFYTAKI